jgi:shikimate kinase
LNIVLIGFMCSGKSRVGRLLSQRLRWPHHDTDEMISKESGISVGEIIQSKGERAFRDIEKKVVQDVSSLDNVIISTGGGVPLDLENMRRLGKRGKIIWLKVSPETVLKRAGDLKSRPLIYPKDPLRSIRERLSQRAEAYSSASYSVDSDRLSLDQMADEIISFFPSLKT